MLKHAFAGLMVAVPLIAAAQQAPANLDKELSERLYGGLRKIDYFGFIHVHVRNPESEKIGLNDGNLSDYLKLRFKNNFGTTPFTEVGGEQWIAPNSNKIGYIWCGVWTVGNDFPIAYHVECNAGSLEKPNILTDAVLGYGNKNNVPDTVRKALDGMISKFAVSFYKIRGEL